MGLLAISAALILTAAFARPVAWRLLNTTIRRDFPEVERISTAELAAWLDDKTRPQPLLLDVRTGAEYRVSHLPGAQWIAPDAPASAIREAKERSIVTYCSVGYRSAILAERLRAAGFGQVLNLEGSIFKWANEDRPLVRDGSERVEQVHPYNQVWGLLLRKRHRAGVAAL